MAKTDDLIDIPINQGYPGCTHLSSDYDFLYTLRICTITLTGNRCWFKEYKCLIVEFLALSMAHLSAIFFKNL